MGEALRFWRKFLEKNGINLDKRNATSLLVLLVLLILLPVGIYLLKGTLNFLPKAADGELIQLGEGGCIKLNKDKKKVVDCQTVPLKLTNPFYNVKGSIAPSSTATSSISSSASPSPAASVISSPSPSSSSTASNCATSVANGTDLLTAISCYKNAGTGGRITLPAGTIEVNKKISVPSGVTIAGAGINSTIIKMSASFARQSTSGSDGDDSLMANDSSNGQQNIVLKDFKLSGDGQRLSNSCCFGLKLQNISDSFVVNVAVDNFGLDGIYLGMRPNKPGAMRNRITGCSVTNNGRNGIALVDGVENVIDHCQISGNSTNELVAAVDLEPDSASEASDNQIFANTITNNHNNGISITQNPHDLGGLVLNNSVCDNIFGGNGGTDLSDSGFGTKTSGCSAGNLNPPAAQLPIISSVLAFVQNIFSGQLIKPVFALGLMPALQNSPYKSMLVSYWKFDETSGTQAADTNFQSNQGPGTAVNTSIVDGKFGKARSISNGGYISLPNIPEYRDNVMSLSAWIKPSSFSPGASIWNQPEGTSLEFTPEADGTLLCFIKPIRENQEGTFSIRSNGTDKLTANQWNHIACTFDMDHLKLYINGRLVASGDRRGWLNQPLLSGQPVLIGKNIASGATINGAIDDVAYWNRALTDAEIASIYNSGLGQAIDLSVSNTTSPSPLASINTNTGDSNDNFTGTSGDDSNDQFTGSSGSPLPASSINVSGSLRYRLAETQDGLAQAQWKEFAEASQSNWLANLFNQVKTYLAEVFKPKPVYAVAGFSGVSNDDCGTLVSQPALHVPEGDIVYKAPVKVGGHWQTILNDGSIVPEEGMKLQHDGDFRTEGGAFFASDHINCKIFITYGDNGGCAVDPPAKGRQGVNGGPLAPGETVTIHFRTDGTPGQVSCNIEMQTVDTGANTASSTPLASINSNTGDSDDNFTGTSGDDSNDQFTTGSPTNSGVTSSGNASFSIGKQFITTNFQLTDIKPGTKQIWVQYMHPDGTTKVDHITFDLVDKTPQLTGLSCNLDIAKQNLNITVDGNFFSNNIGTVTAVPSGTTQVTGWTNNRVTATLKSSGSVTEGQRLQFKVVRTDGFESPVGVCLVDKSLVSLGAKIFCREPGKFDASNVAVSLFYNSDNFTGSELKRVDEKITISKDGEISQLKTQLQAGKNYVISVKAPGTLRRNSLFTASEGTSQITAPDGNPFILPVGDIAPKINLDGQINSLDRAELIRQWRVLDASGSATTTKQSGDFNSDNKVNSIDWACMSYDFGSSDDPLPTEVPQPASASLHIPEPASGTITIPITSPTPSPSR